MKIDVSDIPQPKGEINNILKNGSTEDIINSIQRQDKYYSSGFCKFSKQFGGGNEGLKKLWKFVKHDIRYQKDDFDKSLQLSPPALWSKKSGDCKSKTLFINAVLRCLKIPYVTRYTCYDNTKRFSHVYTVAIINGKEFPIDSVYDFFGKEKAYKTKKDYPMTQIIEINGIKEGNDLQTVRNVRVLSNCDSSPIIVSSNVKRLEEIRQKKRYVNPPEPIKFNEISEGLASIKIAIRELEIIKVMRPEVSKTVEKGLELLRNAEKGNFCPTGDISNGLSGVIDKIKRAERLLHLNANGFGLDAKRIRQLEQIRTQEDGIANINGTFPGRYCMQKAWLLEKDTKFAFWPSQNLQGNWGMCGTNYNTLSTIYVSNSTKTYGTQLIWPYGQLTKYRVNWNEFGAGFQSEIDRLILDGIATGKDGGGSGKSSVIFQNAVDYNLAIERINGASGVLNNYINSVFAADNTRPNGTAGTGLFYTFTDGVTVNNTVINSNRLPGTVLSKRGFQNAYLDGMNLFSGVSRANVKALARNGVLFDNGGIQPEDTLGSLLAIYENRYNAPGINCPPCIVIAAIIPLIAAIVSAVVGIIEATKEADNGAKEIDSSKKDTARLSLLGDSLLAQQDDFLPGKFGSDEKDNNLLLMGAAALGLYAMTRKK